MNQNKYCLYFVLAYCLIFVIGCSSGGDSSTGDTNPDGVPPVPNIPVLQITRDGYDASLDWIVEPNVTYSLYRSTESGCDTTDYINCSDGTLFVNVSPVVLQASLLGAHTYYYQLQASLQAESVISSEVTVTIPGIISMVSDTFLPGGPNNGSTNSSVSDDGRFVVFESQASNLVAGDTNDFQDIFVYDHSIGSSSLKRISVSDTGSQANAHCYFPIISADGRYISFTTEADNLAINDNNNVADAFVYDNISNTIERVSISNIGEEANSTVSIRTTLNYDGRYVGFISAASNLVDNDTNNIHDVFIYDRTLNKIERVSIATDGSEGDGVGGAGLPNISADGRYVVFRSSSTNLVSGDTNDVPDVFIRDRILNTTERISISSSGQQANAQSTVPTVTSDGRYVAFYSSASNLVTNDTNNANDIFIYDRTLDSIQRIDNTIVFGESNGDSNNPRISSDGSFLMFNSIANNFVAGDTNNKIDVFLYDRIKNRVDRINVTNNGVQADETTTASHISEDGTYIIFYTSSRLLDEDINNFIDVYLYRAGSP